MVPVACLLPPIAQLCAGSQWLVKRQCDAIALHSSCNDENCSRVAPAPDSPPLTTSYGGKLSVAAHPTPPPVPAHTLNAVPATLRCVYASDRPMHAQNAAMALIAPPQIPYAPCHSGASPRFAPACHP